MKNMKTILALSSLFVLGVHATDNRKELLSDIKLETKKCARQLTSRSNEGETVTGYKSVCTTLKILSTSEAQILIDGVWLTALISESSDSDGGDLDDLTIQTSHGKILATRKNIPAYDSVIVAMAGDSTIQN
jgi:hypothetical protein